MMLKNLFSILQEYNTRTKEVEQVNEEFQKMYRKEREFSQQFYQNQEGLFTGKEEYVSEKPASPIVR